MMGLIIQDFECEENEFKFISTFNRVLVNRSYYISQFLVHDSSLAAVFF